MASPTTEKRLRPRKTPRQQRAQDTRARILERARGVFAEHGYAAGTTNRIAAAADLSVGSLYQYFPNKDAILVELVHDHVEDGRRAVLAALHGCDRPTDRAGLAEVVHAVVSATVDVHAPDRRLHRVLFEESPRPATLLAELRAVEELAVALVVEWVGPLLRPDIDVELTGRIAVVTIESLVHRLVASEHPLDLDRFTEECVALVLAYLDPKLDPVHRGPASAR